MYGGATHGSILAAAYNDFTTWVDNLGWTTTNVNGVILISTSGLPLLPGQANGP
jgi:hypothetical protein